MYGFTTLYINNSFSAYYIESDWTNGSDVDVDWWQYYSHWWYVLQNKKDVSAVERTLVVTPSNSISHIEVKQEENKKQRILKQGESIMGIAGDVISGLSKTAWNVGNLT